MVAVEAAAEACAYRAEDEEQDEAEALAESSALIGVSEPAALVAAVPGGGAGGAGGSDEFEALLNQLKAEPTEDQEMAAKFMIYETYSEEVSKGRKLLFDLFEESRAGLPDAVRIGMQKELKSIDKENNMGIPDHMRVWFVYHMMRQAGKNNDSMGKIMESFEKRMEFLANNDQDECPICLESFGEQRPATTLGCCHKVCEGCWQNWCAVNHGRPFCPLCKHEEFLEAMHRRASGP
jgi:hypothetical protein